MLAGPIADNLSYHYLFWLPLIPIVAATVLTHLFVPESPVRVPGAGQLARGDPDERRARARPGRGQPDVARGTGCRRRRSGCIAAGAVLLALWVRAETRSRQPLVDMRMMRLRGVWTTNIVALLLGFGMYATFFLLPQFVETPTATATGSARR